MITKSAIESSNYRKKVTATNAARTGWGHILGSLPRGSKILLPSYVGITEREGSGIIDPVLEHKISHDFYLLNDDLSISEKNLETQLESSKYALVLFVHYFGFQIRNIESLVALCRKHQVVVVEDCAHLYSYGNSSDFKAGSLGDYAFYSLHKFFPCHTGGLLVDNGTKDFFSRMPPDNIEKPLLRRLLQYDVSEIISTRRTNYEILAGLIGHVPNLQKMYDLEDGDIPQSFPVIVKDGMREKLYFWLMDHGLPTIALYYRLIDELKAKRYAAMHRISDSILNLPIHQDIDEQDLRMLVKHLKVFGGFN